MERAMDDEKQETKVDVQQDTPETQDHVQTPMPSRMAVRVFKKVEQLSEEKTSN